MVLSRCLSKLIRTRATRVLLCCIGLLLLCPLAVLATPTGNFYEADGEVFDDWDICRTRAYGPDGFFKYQDGRFEPVIAAQSLGVNADVAYMRGVQFGAEYPDLTQRAEAIFAYARDRVRYMSDSSQFGYPEFAVNADELMLLIDRDGIAYGDCEDYAVLLGVMYVAAGMRSAVVLAPGHAAVLVYLPGYHRANRSLTVNGESGWIWAEATGGNNPLGWMPQEYMRSELLAYELRDKGIVREGIPDKRTTTVSRQTRQGFALPAVPLPIIVLLLWGISAAGRRRTSVR